MFSSHNRFDLLFDFHTFLINQLSTSYGGSLRGVFKLAFHLQKDYSCFCWPKMSLFYSSSFVALYNFDLSEKKHARLQVFLCQRGTSKIVNTEMNCLTNVNTKIKITATGS